MTSRLKILVAGVGRSGATILYGALQQLLQRQHAGSRYVFEPFLWNPDVLDAPYDDRLFKDKFERPSSLHVDGIYAHCKTPLFLRDRHTIHDAFVRNHVFETGRTTLVKESRANGRLESFIRLVDAIRIVVVVRNPLDTVNAMAGLRSFFGDEYYPSDKQRYLGEIESAFKVKSIKLDVDDEISWSRLWWRYMTQAAVETAERFPEHIFVLPYEMYMTDRRGSLAEVAAFLGLTSDGLTTADLHTPILPATADINLTRAHVARLEDCHRYYWGKVVHHADVTLDFDLKARARDVWQRYEHAEGVPLLNEYHPNRTAVFYRDALHRSGRHWWTGQLRRLKRTVAPGLKHSA